jgi:hypothetical protein
MVGSGTGRSISLRLKFGWILSTFTSQGDPVDCDRDLGLSDGRFTWYATVCRRPNCRDNRALSYSEQVEAEADAVDLYHCWTEQNATSEQHQSQTSVRLGVVELSEELTVRRTILRNRTTYPRGLHVMFQGDIFVGNVSAPNTTSHAGGHGHSVGK